MINLVVSLAIVASGVILSISAAWAQDADPGKSEFQSSCATCHGIDGEGKGPLGPQLKNAPADLTVLARKITEGFLFRLSMKSLTVEKRWLLMALATCRYGETDMVRMSHKPLSFPDLIPETVIRMRILMVMDYLNRIQKK